MLSKEDMSEVMDYLRQCQESRNAVEPYWKDIVKYMGTAYNRWPDDDRIKYTMKDTTAAEASATFADGVEGYAFSRSLNWFSYGIESIKEGADYEMAKSLLDKVQSVAYSWLAKSNFYTQARQFIRSICDLGTGIIMMDYDRQRSKPRFRTLHLHDCFIGCDEWEQVETLIRQFTLTRKQAIKRFGIDNLPKAIRDSHDDRRKEWTFYQMISPVTCWDFDIAGSGDWISIYWSKDAPEQTVREERLEKPEFIVFRYQDGVLGGDWGVDSPGMIAAPIMRFVNLLMEDLITLSELTAKGHWKKTKGLKVNFRAGGVTELESGQDFALVNATGNLAWLTEHITYYRNTINRIYKTDLFLVLSQNIDRAKTATEVAGIQDEKSSLMSSFFSRLGEEFLEPLHEWLFHQILLHAQVPDITIEEIQAIEDMNMEIDFLSPAFLTQKRTVELSPTIDWMNDMLSLAQVSPNILDRIDFDAFADLDHSKRRALGEVLISRNDAEKARQIRAQIQQAQADQQNRMQTASEAADILSKLSNAAGKTGTALPMTGGNNA